MEDIHRYRIMSNLHKLIQGTKDFFEIFNKLKEKGMFNNYMQSEILSQEPKKRLEFLYQYVTTRGPYAFNDLCHALRETNQSELAAILNSSVVNINSNGPNYLTLEEEFPSDQDWIVKPAVKKFDCDTRMVYRMRSRIKGLALIINIRSFVNNVMDEREGSEHDVKRLQSILQQLDYQVFLVENCTAEEILKQVKKFAKLNDHKKCDSSIVFVMSHGKVDKLFEFNQTVDIVGQDAKTVNSQEIVNQLMASRCEGLRGKPKLFFFQVCRGDYLNFPVLISKEEIRYDGLTNCMNMQTDGLPQTKTPMVRNDSDILIGNATSPGFVSMRDPNEGSWYIQTLCRVFAKYACDTDIVTMHQYVDQYLNDKANEGARQTPTLSLWINKTFYFQPGIYESDYIYN